MANLCLLTPFGCIYEEWARYREGSPPLHSQFFEHLVHVFPTGPTGVCELIATRKALCQEASPLLERIRHGEVKKPNGLPWGDPRADNLMPTYSAVFIMMEQYLKPDWDPEKGELIDLHEYAENATVLLARAGKDQNLSAPISFEGLKAKGPCLPVARTGIASIGDGDIVRVSIATSVKFLSDLHRREGC